MARVMLVALFAFVAAQAQPAVDAGRPGVNLIPNAGFDAPDKHGWTARGKPITVDPSGPYLTPCLRVEYPEGDKHPAVYFVRSDSIPAVPNRTYTFTRTVVDGGRRYVCLVNREYYPSDVTVRLTNAKGETIDLASNARTVTAGTWTLTLGPYELRSFALSPDVAIAGFTATQPEEVTAQLTRVAERVLARAKQETAAGNEVPWQVTRAVGVLRGRLAQQEWAVVRQLLESSTIAPYVDVAVRK